MRIITAAITTLLLLSIPASADRGWVNFGGTNALGEGYTEVTLRSAKDASVYLTVGCSGDSADNYIGLVWESPQIWMIGDERVTVRYRVDQSDPQNATFFVSKNYRFAASNDATFEAAVSAGEELVMIVSNGQRATYIFDLAGSAEALAKVTCDDHND